MSTAGHFITMLGVAAFYLMLLDSKLEKKLTTLIISLISRLNKRINYYIFKQIFLRTESKKIKGYQLIIMAAVLYDYLVATGTIGYTSVASFIKFLIIFLLFTLLIATITLIERKILALTQRRVGPNYIGYKGRLQFIADALKLLAKHIVLISKANRLILIITPSIFLLVIYMF